MTVPVFAANARKNVDGVVSDSIVYFTSQVPSNMSGPAPLKLRKILDLVSAQSVPIVLAGDFLYCSL